MIMSVQIITTSAGDRMVVIPEDEYNRLLEAAEDAADREAVREFRDRLERGEEELLPAEMVKRILVEGDNPVRVWREHRKMTAKALAEKARVAQSYISQIESGKRDGTVETMRKIAAALGIGIDDLIG
jgi:DNA-binding XRE family transcriptional regulator